MSIRELPHNPFDIRSQCDEFLAWHRGFGAGLLYDHGRMLDELTQIIERSIAKSRAEPSTGGGDLNASEERDSDGSGEAGETVKQGSTRRATARAESIAHTQSAIK